MKERKPDGTAASCPDGPVRHSTHRGTYHVLAISPISGVVPGTPTAGQPGTAAQDTQALAAPPLAGAALNWDALPDLLKPTELGPVFRIGRDACYRVLALLERDHPELVSRIGPKTVRIAKHGLRQMLMRQPGFLQVVQGGKRAA